MATLILRNGRAVHLVLVAPTSSHWQYEVQTPGDDENLLTDAWRKPQSRSVDGSACHRCSQNTIVQSRPSRSC